VLPRSSRHRGRSGARLAGEDPDVGASIPPVDDQVRHLTEAGAGVGEHADDRGVAALGETLAVTSGQESADVVELDDRDGCGAVVPRSVGPIERVDRLELLRVPGEEGPQVAVGDAPGAGLEELGDLVARDGVGGHHGAAVAGDGRRLEVIEPGVDGLVVDPGRVGGDAGGERPSPEVVELAAVERDRVWGATAADQGAAEVKPEVFQINPWFFSGILPDRLPSDGPKMGPDQHLYAPVAQLDRARDF
jgi:hypothetical protein